MARPRASFLAAGLVVLLAVGTMATGPASAFAAPAPAAGAATFTFQAEVARLMDILVHSLYSNRDVFLRELVSNASDALDKARVLALRRKAGQNGSAGAAAAAAAKKDGGDADGDAAAAPPAPPPVADAAAAAKNDDTLELAVRVWLDPGGSVLNIRDTGVGMTRDELVKNLGTIARSGTSAFLDQLQNKAGDGKSADGGKSGGGGDASLIGQFGVGFYSAFLVSDWVEVISKSDSDPKAWVWASAADGGFTVAEDDPSARAGPAAGAAADGNASSSSSPFDRGTWLRLHLKEDARDYASEPKLRELVSRYSEFINYPIYLETEKEVDVPIEQEEETKKAGGDGSDEIGEDAAKTAAGGGKKSPGKKSSSSDAEDEGVEDEDAEDDAKIAAAKGGSLDDEDESDADKKPATRKEKRKEWAVLNEQRPIWLRAPSEVSKSEYNAFYKSLSRDWQDPLAHVHFRAEGDLDFRALAFIPKSAPHDFYEKYHEPSSSARPSVKLYSRRVLVADDLGDALVPKYLSWARGAVDSDALPLSVSRETLQASGSLRTVKKKLGRKLLDAVRRLADEQEACLAEKKEGKKDADADDKKDGDAFEKKDVAACSSYTDFYEAFGRALKMGIIEDASNRGRLAKLLRFRSSLYADEDKPPSVSLDAYAKRARDGAAERGGAAPKHVLFVTAPSIKEAKASPFAEAAAARGFEVLYLTDVLDEYVTQHLTEHDDLQLADVARDGTVDWAKLSAGGGGGAGAASSDGGADSGDASSSSSSSGEDAVRRAKDADKLARKRLRPLTKWWKAVLGPGTVGGVRVSARLPPGTPAAVSAGRHGPSAQMERIMRAQAMGGQSAQAQAQAAQARQARFLEINPTHPLVERLADLVGPDWSGDDDGSAGAAEKAGSSVPYEARATALLLYDAALLEGGYLLDDARETTRRVYSMLMGGAGGGGAGAGGGGGGGGAGGGGAAAADAAADAPAPAAEEKEEEAAKDEGVEDEHDEL